MSFEIRPLGDGIGAEMVGIDLAGPVTDDEIDTIRKAWFENAVIVFRDQQLDPAGHVAFSRRFGDLAIHVADQFHLPGHPEILVLSNRKRGDGTPVGFEDAGRYWHSDVSYDAEPVLGSMLYAVEIPPAGGDTLFADMCRAYDTLTDETRRRIEGLRAVHSYTHNYKKLEQSEGSRPDITAAQSAQLNDVVHPMVRLVEDTGAKALFVNPGFTYAIEGLGRAESDALLQELFAHSTRPELIYTHQWRPHDLLCWDNRSVMHHATLYDTGFTRHMHRTTLKGTRPV